MNCKNCDTALTADSSYCNMCGAKIIRKRLTLKNLFEHISETFFNYDNKLLRTFVDLFKKPEVVIGTYVDGVRMRYVNPISFFGVSLTLSGLSIFIIKKFYLEYLDFSSMFSSEMYNEAATKQMIDNQTTLTFEYGSLLQSAMIPFMALISFIVFYNKKYNFTEHIVLYLYSMSAIMILSVVVGQIILFIVPEHYITFAFLTYLFMLLYYLFSLKRIFKLTVKQLILKTLLFFVVAFLAYIGFSIIAAIIMLATGAFNPQDFAPPAS